MERIAEPVVSPAQSTSVVEKTLPNRMQGWKEPLAFDTAGGLVFGPVWAESNKGSNKMKVRSTFMFVGLRGQKKGKFGKPVPNTVIWELERHYWMGCECELCNMFMKLCNTLRNLLPHLCPVNMKSILT